MLTAREKMILDFAGAHHNYIGVKEQAIRERFDVVPTHYYQELNRLVDREAANAHAPMLVSRIRSRRKSRTHCVRTLAYRPL